MDIPSDLLQAFIHGNLSDPSTLLGLHRDHHNNFSIRVFIAKAEAVELWDTKESRCITIMESLHDGFFVATIEKKISTYALRVYRQNEWHFQHDPYRFPPVLGSLDFHLFHEGQHWQIYNKLGSHLVQHEGIDGCHFAVWAPNARRVAVVGDFNHWDTRQHSMIPNEQGVWQLFIPHLTPGLRYKYQITGEEEPIPWKSDPYAQQQERPPDTASVIINSSHYPWQDQAWLSQREKQQKSDQPLSIYEVHAGSWQKPTDKKYFNFRELAERLIPYVKFMGFSHIELLPISEHPFGGSWGYQPLGLFSVSRRFGEPDDFRYFVDQCHQNRIGVILDWSAAHFPSDTHGLSRFDGTALYEHEDPRQGWHPDWQSYIYNFGRKPVSNYLIANALFWIKKFHIDGLRVDAVASMLYLDYSREADQWIPNIWGGNENLEAIEFLKTLNREIQSQGSGAIIIAEESTSWPGVTHPLSRGGLGFNYKWNMGWMHDTLNYMQKEPIHRKHHHNHLTFGPLYAFSEQFCLPFSHDEVVHGKGSLINKMPGDTWQKAANLRLLFAYHFFYPGKKLLFMGCEFAQWREWNHNQELDWFLLEREEGLHHGIQRLVKDLNHLYGTEPALYQGDCDPQGFSWIDCNNEAQSIVVFLRRAPQSGEIALVILNNTPVPRYNYRIGAPIPGDYLEAFNSDSQFYQGSNLGNGGRITAMPESCHNHPYSLSLTLPPLAALLLIPESLP
ncbi:1,4-alpha-glucan branching protein GlgB [Magnetococcales bacterium HHB-1]